eukprot:6068391-Alexandrium_andersonii.AAC.1
MGARGCAGLQGGPGLTSGGARGVRGPNGPQALRRMCARARLPSACSEQSLRLASMVPGGSGSRA